MVRKENRRKHVSRTVAIHRIAWSFQARHDCLRGDGWKRVRAAVRQAAELLGLEVLDLDIKPHRVSLLAVVPPKPAVHTLITRLKGLAVYCLLQDFPEMAPEIIDVSLWSPGYLAVTYVQALSSPHARVHKK